jgi:hypothetical protein
MRTWLNFFAQKHPRIFSGIWFGGSAAILVAPIAAMALLMMAVETATGRPNCSYLALLCATVLLPPLLAFLMGGVTGPILLKLSHGWAAVLGSFTGVSTFILWAIILELVPRILFLLTSGNSRSEAGGDVPGAAEVVAYLVILPGMVVLSLLFGATAGVLLRCIKS